MPLVWQLGQDMWANDDGLLDDIVNCVVSVSTGRPNIRGIDKSAYKFLSKTLEDLVTETEETAANFATEHRSLIPKSGEQKYFRFNVLDGLENVALDEHEKVDLIEVATFEYLETDQARQFELDRCSERLSQRQLIESDSLPTSVNRAPVYLSECIRTLLRHDTAETSSGAGWFKHWRQNIKDPYVGSLKWMWQDDSDNDLSKWLTEKSGMCWIRGKPGSGKSVAMKHLFTEYKRKRGDGEIVIGFFFNKLGSDFGKSLEGLLRVVLARILKL
ncbi:hypothetical protein B0T26DRAFT_756606 [Lasiosphaeria miniovina]|uniref:Nephrocystin 3-like N-terminal domain-containing protein n=1 Tax=Lasiosphaeria miniovina TaxID=1954250 RepID=A0AA39ZSW7_9PEZI|nr:uncharacterized protein B0T26DRAFT_756606 [Lasiosphaeria miniovina]KAK0703016.1 hypothetical protein B0T26DRAFT_756606 [Lasiosphaeria miniovina]